MSGTRDVPLGIQLSIIYSRSKFGVGLGFHLTAPTLIGNVLLKLLRCLTPQTFFALFLGPLEISIPNTHSFADLRIPRPGTEQLRDQHITCLLILFRQMLLALSLDFLNLFRGERLE